MLEFETTKGQGGVLNLGVLPTFGTRWLIPRIPDFNESHPEVALNLTTRIAPFDFEAEELDAAIHHGDEVWPGARLERLMDDELVVVAEPQFVKRHRIAVPSDLPSQVLLQLESRPGAWAEWLHEAGLPTHGSRQGPRFEHHLMIIQAALSGLGVALLPWFLVKDELASGALQCPFGDQRQRTGRAYWLAYPQRHVDLPALVAFRSWLRTRLKQEQLWAGAHPGSSS